MIFNQKCDKLTHGQTAPDLPFRFQNIFDIASASDGSVTAELMLRGDCLFNLLILVVKAKSSRMKLLDAL